MWRERQPLFSMLATSTRAARGLHMNLRRATKQEGKSGNDTIELLKRLLVEMRRDVGRSDLNFNKVILSICCWIAILFV